MSLARATALPARSDLTMRHCSDVEKPSVRRHADTSEALAIVARLQRALRRRRSRTEVVSASFLSLTEVFR